MRAKTRAKKLASKKRKRPAERDDTPQDPDRIDIVIWYCLACGRCEALEEHLVHVACTDTWVTCSGRKLHDLNALLASLGCGRKRIRRLLRDANNGTRCAECPLKTVYRYTQHCGVDLS